MANLNGLGHRDHLSVISFLVNAPESSLSTQINAFHILFGVILFVGGLWQIYTGIELAVRA